MKFMKWKSYFVTALVCLLPILPGLLLWEQLPDAIAIHFDMYNTPDTYASKAFAVFGIPALMALLQLFCCFVNDINTQKYGERPKFTRATKWIIPVMSVLLQGVTFAYALGAALDIRKIAACIVGAILLLVGNYLPKFDYVKNYDIDTEPARKINRFIGYETIGMGILFFVSIFLPPWATVGCLFFFIPYVILAVWYGIRESKKGL